MGKVGWIIAIILIILALAGGITMGITIFKGGFVAEFPSISYSAITSDLCNPQNLIIYGVSEEDIAKCVAHKHLLAGGYKCVCDFK